MSRGGTGIRSSARFARAFTVLVLLVGGLLLRVDAITKPSLATRELHNALLAREYYFDAGASLPAWQQNVLRDLRLSVKPIEPPVLDHVGAWSFRLVGGERLWIPRFLSALFWVLGGVFLYLIGRRITSHDGALVALVLYLVWPYGVFLSRHYMPDATMVALLLAAAWAVVRYWDRPSRSRLLVAGAISTLATAVKPGVALVFLIALFASLALSRRSLLASLRGPLPIFTVLSGAASGIYYVYGTYVRDFLSGETAGRIEPSLLATEWFWRGWWEMVSIVLTFPQRQHALALVPLAAGIVGVAVAGRGAPRAVLVGLGLGYLAYGLAFAAHTPSHAYYALPLLPILALSIGVLAGAVLERSRETQPARFVLAGLLALVAVAAAYKSHATLASPYDREAIADYQRIGKLTGHTTRAMIVDQRLRTPLMYWGWVVGEYWYAATPLQDLPSSGPLRLNWDPADFDYLVVVGPSELEGEPRLRSFTRHLPVVSSTRRYAVLDLRHGAGADAAKREGIEFGRRG
jgi:4-amino-4-deoxy-L-arabinose transferase-like glycosyltransferase